MPAKSPLYIVLNGASETGKSTLIASGLMYRFKLLNEQFLQESNDPADYSLTVVQDSFANPMKHFIATTLGVKYSDLKKNTMMAIIQGYTPREFLIHLSEHYIKERYGDDAFGRWLEHRVLRLDPLPDVVVIDDGGFPGELGALGYSAKVIRVNRPGKTFEGDSREYMPDPHYTLDNDGTIEDLELKLDQLANWIIDQLPINRRPPLIQE